MKPFASFVIQIAVTLQLQLSPAQITPSSSSNSTTGGSAPAITPAISSLVQIHSAGEMPGGRSGCVLMFQEVWGRSFCRTLEKLVEVVQEYPGEVEHIYSPSCVPLVRCAGCCGDENLECHPTRTSNVTMQLLKIKPAEQGQEYVEMTFVEHQTCECRIRKAVVKSERRRQRGRGKKRKERQRGKDCDRCQPPRR